jgi:hypothetical protein
MGAALVERLIDEAELPGAALVSPFRLRDCSPCSRALVGPARFLLERTRA